ncbi:MAG: HPr family phosphocarrier protein [Spartobacteria bacterium]|nr:HPr family phosphocarrier protein [Spartobacteria bacterium]
MNDGEEISKKVQVGCPEGIHMRIAAELLIAARGFNAVWHIEKDGMTASGQSLLQVLALGACLGSQLTLWASGPQAASLIEKLSQIIQQGIG